MRADRRKYPERTLGKFLWLRDLLHLVRYELEAHAGAITPTAVGYCEEAVKLYEMEFLGGMTLYALDGLDYYSEALRVLNRGFDATWMVGAGPHEAHPGETRRARFSSVEAWRTALDAMAEASVAPFSGKYV